MDKKSPIKWGFFLHNASKISNKLLDFELIDKKEQLMKTLDNVHTKFGKKKLGVGPCYVPDRNWSMSRDKLSKNPFTWDELLIISK